MSSALGVLRWTPETFWKATVFEFTSALKGYLGAKGVDFNPPMDRNDFLALKAQVEANERRMSGGK